MQFKVYKVIINKLRVTFIQHNSETVFYDTPTEKKLQHQQSYNFIKLGDHLRLTSSIEWCRFTRQFCNLKHVLAQVNY